MKRKPAQVIPFRRPGMIDPPGAMPGPMREIYFDVQAEMMKAGTPIEPEYRAVLCIWATAATRVADEWPKFHAKQENELGEVTGLLRKCGADLLLPDAYVERYLCAGMSPAVTN